METLMNTKGPRRGSEGSPPALVVASIVFGARTGTAWRAGCAPNQIVNS